MFWVDGGEVTVLWHVLIEAWVDAGQERGAGCASMSAVIVSSGTVATPVSQNSGSGLGNGSDGEYSMVT